MTKKRGTARIRGLAAELKDLRAQSGLSTREAASRAGISSAKLNRIELGNRMIEVEDVVALSVVYGVTGLARERLLAMSREASLPGWWETGGGDLPKELPTLIAFESEATRIVSAAMLRIPGLMQTSGYTRAIMTSGRVTGVEARVSARLGRQAVLTRPHPPHYLAIIDEGVLHRPVGGARVMEEQIKHLIDLAKRPNIDIRVIPLDYGAHAGLNGTYMTLEFARARTIAYLEHKRSSLFIDDPVDVAPFQETTDILLETALDSPESVDFLGRIAADYVQR